MGACVHAAGGNPLIFVPLHTFVRPSAVCVCDRIPFLRVPFVFLPPVVSSFHTSRLPNFAFLPSARIPPSRTFVPSPPLRSSLRWFTHSLPQASCRFLWFVTAGF